MSRTLCIFVGLFIGLGLEAPAADPSVRQFLSAYCLDCHDHETRKGEVDLEFFHEERDLRQLFDVYDQVVLEYMPPAKKRQPSAQERAAFVAALEAMLAEKNYDRKLQPGLGNYVDHESLFTPSTNRAATARRVWRVDPSAMAEIANNLIGHTVYRQQRQGVTKEHPSFAYRAPAHTFKDFDSTSYFENTTTELALGYAKEIADHMEEYRFGGRARRILRERGRELEAQRLEQPDRISVTHELLFNRPIPPEERAELERMDPRWAVAALILKSESVFRVESTMDSGELARALGFALNESGPDPDLYVAVAERPLGDVLDERMSTEAFNWRLVRFLREYFEYGKAPDVFKDPEDQPSTLFKRGVQYRPEWHVEDADHFCLRIVREDRDVLQQLLTSNTYSVKGGLNSHHIKILKRAEQNGYLYGYHGIYGIQEEELSPWRRDYTVPDRLGMLQHPAWLIAFSDNEKNQAIQRGRWITTKLLGGYVPDAPVEVDASLPTDPNLTLREKMRVTQAPRCIACHRHMDDLGLPFEQFDFLGHFRTTEIARPVAVTGRAMGRTIADPFSYVRMLAASPRVRQVFLRHAFRFFMGRNESLADADTLIAMDSAYQPEGSLKTAVKALLMSDSYRLRK